MVRARIRKSLLIAVLAFSFLPGRAIAGPTDGVTAEVKGAAENVCGLPPLSAGGPDGYGYIFRDQAEAGGPVYNFIDISATGTQVTFLGGTYPNDDGYANITLSAPFTFYGLDITAVTMSANGYLSTVTEAYGFDFSNDCPLPQTPGTGDTSAGRLYPLHDDLVVNGGGYHQHFAICPLDSIPGGGADEDCTVIMWQGVDVWGPPETESGDFEVILFHDSDEVRFQYRNISGALDGSSSTTGIQSYGPEPAYGLTYACNTAASITGGTAVSFFPTEVGNLGLLMTADTQSPDLGQPVTFSLQVANAGPDDQHEVTVTDILPSGLSYVENTCGALFTGGSLTWTIGDLANGSVASCRFTATYDACHPVVNTASVAGDYGMGDPPDDNAYSVNLNESLANAVSDGGFEAGTPSGIWTEYSTNFLTPICSGSCGDFPPGTVGPHSGECWAWFGGSTGVPEEGWVEQTVVIPNSPNTYLSFYFWNGASGGTGNDYTEVLIDGNQVWQAIENDPLYTGGYTLVALDLAALGYADGGSHSLKFRGVQTTGALTNFSLDDIAVSACDTYTGLLFFDDFTDGARAGDPEWTEKLGDWSVSLTKKYVSRYTRNDLSVVTAFDPLSNPLASGRIEARVKMTSLFVRYANATIIFAYQDNTHYRYARLRPGRLIIGQAGDFGGESAGIKKKSSHAFRVRRWYSLRVDIHGDGRVNVYDGDTLVGGHTFGAAVPGGVGLAARKAKSLFDDFAVWHESLLP